MVSLKLPLQPPPVLWHVCRHLLVLHLLLQALTTARLQGGVDAAPPPPSSLLDKHQGGNGNRAPAGANLPRTVEGYDWDQMLAEGRAWRNQLDDGDHVFEPSRYRTEADMTKAGWRAAEADEMDAIEDPNKEEEFLDAVGLSTDLDDYTHSLVCHAGDAAGERGCARSMWDVGRGALLAGNMKSAEAANRDAWHSAHAVPAGKSDAQVRADLARSGAVDPVRYAPEDFRFWSDFVFIDWARLCKKANRPVNTLRRIGFRRIINDVTLAAIQDIMKRNKLDYTQQLPAVFPGSSDEAAVMLRTPNGKAAYRLLSTHREELDPMTIDKLLIFNNGEQADGVEWNGLDWYDTYHFVFMLKPAKAAGGAKRKAGGDAAGPDVAKKGKGASRS